MHKKIQVSDLYLYHLTCEHSLRGIQTAKKLLPNVHPYMPHLGPLLWLTDLPEPTPEQVGLTSSWTSCNRLQYRYIVRSKAAIPWSAIRERAPRERAPKDVVETLESFAQPEHWYVARRPLLSSEFEFDESYAGVAVK